MTDDRKIIEDYARQVGDRLAGSARERRAVGAELVDHLTDAAEAGELREALRRLGTPESAAQSFAGGGSPRPASPGRRLAAALIDNLPLIVVTIALLAQDLARGGDTFAAFPPQVYVRLGDAVCVGPPIGAGCGAYQGAGLLYALGVPAALAWSVIGLGIVESRTGTTPGKRLLGLRVVTETGLRIGALAGMVRRTSLLAGPLAWLDWVPFLAGRRQRLLDHVAGTKVVTAPAGRDR